jgi:hypothetical protein
MTTQQLYQKVINEQMSHEEFLWNVRRDTRVNGILTNTMSYEDTVGVLKSKGYIWENVQGEEVAKMDFLGSFKALNEENKLKGGKGDKLTADQVNYHEFTKGWKHELEHTDDIEKAKEIALDHLEEDPNYYTRLDMIEYQAKKAKKESAPKEVSKTNLKDKENQMTSPKGVKKEKANVGRKKEKAKKVAGVKTMKGGSEAPKTIKEAVDKTMKYDPNQMYLWRYKDANNDNYGNLDKEEFDTIMRASMGENPRVIDFYKTSQKDIDVKKNLFAKYTSKKDQPTDKKTKEDSYKVKVVKGPLAGKYMTMSVSEIEEYEDNYGKGSTELVSGEVPTSKPTAPKGKLTKYMILKGPGAGSKNPVDLDQKQAEDHIRKHGPDSLEPVNKPSDTAKSTPQNLGSLENKYVVIDTKSKEKGTSFVVGKVHDNMNDARKAAEQDKDYKAIPGKILRAQKSIYGISEDVTNEELNKADEKAMKSVGINFIIAGTDDPDEKINVSDKIVSASFNKKKAELEIKLASGGNIVFTQGPTKNVVGVYTNPNRKSSNLLDIKAPLTKFIDKAFGKADPQQQPAEEPMNEALVNYIRQRIRKILKEGYNEEGQYPGVAGPDVVKKKLHHVMQTYDWGFQDSKDPFVRDNGNQKNSLATKLIFDLGPDGEGIIIFNSYAPKGFEISSIDDLGGYTGAVNGGMPQDRAFNPDKLTARGGRVAESFDEDIKRYVDMMKKDIDSPELEDTILKLTKMVLNGSVKDNPIARKFIARVLGEYIGYKGGAQKIQNKNIISAFHKV